MQEETKTELWFSDYESDLWINCTHRGFFRFWQNLIEVDHRDFRDLNTAQLPPQKRAHIDCTVFRRADPRIRSARDQPFFASYTRHTADSEPPNIAGGRQIALR